MPNIVTHMVVAERLHEGASPDFLIGSALPDFVGMHSSYTGHTMKPRDIQDPVDFREGVLLHLATDAAFDSLPKVRELQAVGREDCEVAVPEIGRSSARAVILMGTDILLDEPVLETDLGDTVYERVKLAILSGDTAIAQLPVESLSRLITDYFVSNRARTYGDTETLAAIMNHRFRLRGRGTDFPNEFLPQVGEVLGRQLDRIRACSEELLDLTLDELKQRHPELVDISTS